MPELDGKDLAIIAERMWLWDERQEPRVGDYVLFEGGRYERISHDWGDEVQTSPSGSFYMSGGHVSFSGGLNPAIPVSSLTLTEEKRPGWFWIFHHNIITAHNGVDFQEQCRVYRTTAPYRGFLREGL